MEKRPSERKWMTDANGDNYIRVSEITAFSFDTEEPVEGERFTGVRCYAYVGEQSYNLGVAPTKDDFVEALQAYGIYLR